MLSAQSLSTHQGWVGSYYLQYSNIVNNAAVYQILGLFALP